MRALIIGGGVAGNAAALALDRVGWEPVVFEAYERSAGLDQGVFLTIAVNGLAALDAIDAGDAVRQLGFATGQIRFLSGTGKELGALDIGPRRADGDATRTVRRAELYAALGDEVVARGIETHHGKRLVDATTTADGVTATFADGSTATGDVLIGADGLRSTVRQLIDPAAPEPRYTGLTNLGGFSRVPGARFEGGDYRMTWGKRAFFGSTVSPDGEVWWFANEPRRQPLTDADRQAAPEQVKAQLAELFTEDAGAAAQIVAASGGDLLNANGYDLPRVKTWHRGRMLVIGDAAHAVSPATGQGASLAIEDAVVLARCLAAVDAGNPGAAFAAYEGERRERVERVVAYGKRLGTTKTAGPVGRWVRDLVLPRFLAMAASPKAMAKQAWIFDYRARLS